MQGPFGLPGRHLPPPLHWIDLERRVTVSATAAVGASVITWQQFTVTLTDPFICTGFADSNIEIGEIGYGPDALNVTPVVPLVQDPTSLQMPAVGLSCVLPAGVNHLWLRTQDDANTKTISTLSGFYAPGAPSIDRTLLVPNSGLWLDRGGSLWVSPGAWIVGVSDTGGVSSAGTITLMSGGSTHSTLLSVPAASSWPALARGAVVPIKPVHVPTGFGLGYGTNPVAHLIVSTNPGAWSPLQVQGGLY